MVEVLRAIIAGIYVSVVPCFQVCSGFAITISSDMVISGRFLKVEEDRLDEARFVHIGPVIG